MKKVTFMLMLVLISACEQKVASNPCPKGNGGLYADQAYYECLDRQFSGMRRRL